jgi:hypothetical protein
MGTQCINSTNTGTERKASENIKLYRFFDTSKCTDSPVHTVKAYSRGHIALNLVARWGSGVNFTHQWLHPGGGTPDTQLGGLDISEKRKISCPYWNLKPGLSSL